METRHIKKHTQIKIMGDSLSDMGTLYKRKLFGFIPMSWLSGLLSKAPGKVFTNGTKVWVQFLGAALANNFFFKEEEKQGVNVNDIDYNQLPKKYSLDDDHTIKYEGRPFIKAYDEGGMTSHHWFLTPFTSIARFFSRLLLPTLHDKRKQLLSEDTQNATTNKEKKKTLIVEWSGANDLLTVNSEPTNDEAKAAVKARIKNVKKLIKHGYHDFLLFNMPDFSQTPRYASEKSTKTAQERKAASDTSIEFNRLLTEKVQKLNQKFPHCDVRVFDVNSRLTKLEQDYKTDPKMAFEKYGLNIDPTKINESYVDSKDFVPPVKNPTDPDFEQLATGYTYWDDVHPSEQVHNFLAGEVYNYVTKNYHIVKPTAENTSADDAIPTDPAKLVEAFKEKYKKILSKDQHGLFGRYRSSGIDLNNVSLESIIEHAKPGNRTYKVLQNLYWLDKNGVLNESIQKALDAKRAVKISA